MYPNSFVQYRYESNAWKRLLCFMMEENIHAKNRIAEVLQEPVEVSMLEELEGFQTGFIEKDGLIYLFRNEVSEFDKHLVDITVENGLNTRFVCSTAKKLRREINFAEQAFNSYHMAFSQFLSEDKSDIDL